MRPPAQRSCSGVGSATLGRADLHLLFSSATPLSFSDILERLKISKGSLSQGLQLLRSFGAVRLSERSRNQKHSLSRATPLRRDYFEPELAVKRRTKSAGGALIFTSEERLTRLHELAGQVGNDIFLSARINWRYGGLTSFCCAHWDARAVIPRKLGHL